MSELAVFQFRDKFPVRVSDRDGAPWFVAADVCKALDLANPRNAVARLDEDERATVQISDGGQPRKFNIISESGLYALIIRSNKPEAREFRKWVTAEVLPAIRRTGRYETAELLPPEPKNDFREISNSTVRMILELNRRIIAGDSPSPHVLKYAGSLAATSGSLLFQTLKLSRRVNDLTIEERVCNFLRKNNGCAERRKVMWNLHVNAFELDTAEQTLTQSGAIVVERSMSPLHHLRTYYRLTQP